MPNQSISLTDLDPETANIRRNQRLADMLQQQLSDPIPIQSSGGIQAPISPFSVLAKALRGYSARKYQEKADEELSAYRDKDNAAAQALARQLTAGTTQVGTPNIAPGTTQIDATAPQLPGGPAPAPITAQIGISGQQGTGLTQAPPDLNAQLAALLSAHGGPQTQMIQQTMLPQVMQRQNLDYQHRLGREDKVWENGLPMPIARQQEIDAQSKAAQGNAEFANNLPQTAAQRATTDLGYAQLGETRAYHQQMGGAGLTADGSPNPAVAAWRDAIKRGDANMANVPSALKNAVAVSMAGVDKTEYTPKAASLNTLASSRITQPYTNMAAYKLTADGLPYLQRIDAAMKHPGSVSDQDLLDSLTKLNTGGNAVTEAQVALITGHGSLADWAGTMSNKLKNGGALSDNQRQQIKAIANDIFTNYRKGYEPIYQEATAKLRAAGIPEPFWTIPNLNKLNAGQQIGESRGGAPGKVPPPPPGFVVHP